MQPKNITFLYIMTTTENALSTMTEMTRLSGHAKVILRSDQFLFSGMTSTITLTTIQSHQTTLGDVLSIIAVVDKDRQKILAQYVPVPRGTSKSKGREMKSTNIAELEKIISNDKFKEKTTHQQRIAVVGKDNTFLVYSDSKSNNLCYCVIGGRNLVHQDTFRMIHDFVNVYAPYKDTTGPSRKLQQDIKNLVDKYTPDETLLIGASQSDNGSSQVGIEEHKDVPCFCCC